MFKTEYINRNPSYQIPVQHPVAVQIVNPVQDLVQQTLDHSLRHEDRLLAGLRRPMELDDVPQIVLGEIEQQPHLPVDVRQEHPDQVDHVRVLQLAQQLEIERSV